jgi:transcriptional regulator with XRE-family HTH domain
MLGVYCRGRLADFKRVLDADLREFLLDVDELPDDAVQLVLADPAQTPGPNKPTHPLPARSYQEVADIVCGLSSLFIAARDRRGLSTRAAARQLDVAPSTVSRLESGSYPSVEVTLRVLEWLEEDCPVCKADAHTTGDPAQTTELEKLAADHLALLGQRDEWWEHVGRERRQLEVELDERQARIKAAIAIVDKVLPGLDLGDGAAGGDALERVRSALAGDQPTAGRPPAPRCFCIGPTHLIVCADQREPLSGVALRDVEERDDAAGDQT